MLLIFLAAGFGAIFLSHTAPFPFLLEALAPGRSLWHVPASEGPPTIYLTFDDGPNPTVTPGLLDVLEEEGVPATFFVIPDYVTEETAPIVQRMFEEGHAVALHSNTRELMVESPGELAEAITEAADEIEQLTGGRPCRLFRPHAGWRSGAMYEGLARVGHRLVGWSWRLWDWNWWRRSRPDRLVARLLQRVSAGDIVVMHDGHHGNPRADRRETVEAVAKLVPALQARGFEFGILCAPGVTSAPVRFP